MVHHTDESTHIQIANCIQRINTYSEKVVFFFKVAQHFRKFISIPLDNWTFRECIELIAHRIYGDICVVIYRRLFENTCDTLENRMARIRHNFSPIASHYDAIGCHILFVRFRLNETALICYHAVFYVKPKQEINFSIFYLCSNCSEFQAQLMTQQQKHRVINIQ